MAAALTWPDECFLDWCLARSRTEAVFSRDDVVQLYELAGHPLQGNLPEIVTMREPIVRQLVEQARARVNAAGGGAV